MKSKDLIDQEKTELLQKLTTAMQSGDETGMAAAFSDFAKSVQESVIKEAKELAQVTDSNVLAARGVRQLTSGEREFYQGVITASRSGNPKQALVDIDKAMPQTIIDSVIEDIKENHPLLDAVDFVNTNGAIRMILNADDVDLATWGALNTSISEELAGKIELVDISFAKLSAYIPVAKDMLDLGPVWIDSYVRLILAEALAAGLENGIVNGTGKNQPIGMTKDLDGSVTQGVYPDKSKVALTSLEPAEYCGVIAPLANKPNGGYRAVPEVMLLVNPVDYIQKVLPATTVRAADGTYKNNIFPYPTRVIQTNALTTGNAVIGLVNKYFMGVGAGKSGTIEYSDEYQFLEDARVYLTKLHGNGRPKDNNAFIYLDISKLKPADLKVEITNTAENPVNTKAAATS